MRHSWEGDDPNQYPSSACLKGPGANQVGEHPVRRHPTEGATSGRGTGAHADPRHACSVGHGGIHWHVKPHTCAREVGQYWDGLGVRERVAERGSLETPQNKRHAVQVRGLREIPLPRGKRCTRSHGLCCQRSQPDKHLTVSLKGSRPGTFESTILLSLINRQRCCFLVRLE